MKSNPAQASRREAIKLLGAAAPFGATAFAQQRGGRGRPQFDGVLTPSPTAVPGGKPLLTLYSISLQWAGYARK
jgi:hypothetical protein